MHSRPPSSRIVPAAQGAFVATLCVLLATPQGYALSPAEPVNVPASSRVMSLTPNQRVEHALSRLTFGPRPGDEVAVSKIGLDAWFQRQLHPESIDDSAFEARLAMFPSLGLSQAQLVEQFPPPQLIRKTALEEYGQAQPTSQPYTAIQNLPAPTDTQTRAILNDAAYAYAMDPKKTAGEQKIASGTAGDAAPMTTQMSTSDAPSKGKAGGNAARTTAPHMPAGDVQAVLDLPPDQRMQRLLSMTPPEMFSFRASLRPFQKLELAQGMDPRQLEILGAMQSPIRVVGAEALEGRLLRDIDSERQLQAVMTDFWLNHFSVYAKKNQNEPYLLNAYLRDAILPNALGNFEKLLVATAESPAMLMYLDNWESIGPDSPAALRGARAERALDPNTPAGKLVKARPKGINENYARELMELHTIGVRCEVSADHPRSGLPADCGNGYTQTDVTNVAKVLTGWTIEKPYQTGGEMVFDANRHEPGDKPVLGTTIRQGGSAEGMQVLHMLANSTATAHFISYKLAVRFVSDTPPDALVNRMADSFTQTHGDIKSVLTTMFDSPEFWATDVYRAKIKTPVEFVASAVRASGVQVNNPLVLVQAMDKLGMPIYGMQTPNGYSWMHDEWVSSNALIARMNFALVLSGDLLPGARPDWPALLGESGHPDLATDPTPDTERKLEIILLGQPASEKTRASVLSESKDPNLQRSAQKSFASVRGQSLDAEDEPPSTMGIKPPRVLHKPGKDGGGGLDLLQSSQSAAPLDTMAGLLLGSPDFQRR